MRSSGVSTLAHNFDPKTIARGVHRALRDDERSRAEMAVKMTSKDDTNVVQRAGMDDGLRAVARLLARLKYQPNRQGKLRVAGCLWCSQRGLASATRLASCRVVSSGASRRRRAVAR